MIIILIGVVSLLFLIYVRTRRPKNFPPGPNPIPIFGNVFQFGNEGHSKAMEMEKIYGKIIGLSLGPYNMVILQNVDDIREALNRPEIQGRRMYNLFLDKNPGETHDGVIMSEGKMWLDLRRFSLKTLRDFGFGKRSMESIITEEADDLIQEFKKTAGTPITTQNVFNGAVLNVVWSIIAGTRYPHDHKQLRELTKLVLDLMKNAVGIEAFMYFLFPLSVRLKSKFPLLFPKTFDLCRVKLFEFLKKAIRQHRETMEMGNPRDFIDTYLEEAIKAKGDANSSFKSDDDDYGLSVLLLDFFVAGSETTSTTLTWAMFLLAMNEQVGEKVYKEIQSVVGNRAVTLDDRVKLPYTEATMTEVYRMSSLIPMGVSHTVIEDGVTFKGFNLPKGTIVAGNAYAVHFNKEIWGDPDHFRPERFLSPEDGKSFVQSKFVIPFSVGKRQCLGETLARQEFFVFLANLVQNFKITMPSDEPKHSIKGQPGAALTPEPHKIIFVDRNK